MNTALAFFFIYSPLFSCRCFPWADATWETCEATWPDTPGRWCCPPPRTELSPECSYWLEKHEAYNIVVCSHDIWPKQIHTLQYKGNMIYTFFWFGCVLDEGNAKLLTLTVGVVASALSDRVAILHILPTAPPETEKKKKIICQTITNNILYILYIFISRLMITSSVSWSIWSRICHPMHSTGLWPDSSQRTPLRTRHSGGEPGGSRPTLIPHTVVAMKKQRQRSENRNDWI